MPPRTSTSTSDTTSTTTSTGAAATSAASASRSRKRAPVAPDTLGSPRKRPRLAADGASHDHEEDENEGVREARHAEEEVDLSIAEGTGLTSRQQLQQQLLLDRERRELVRSQQQGAKRDGEDEEEGNKRFGEMSCIICMDRFTDVTATVCGHIFCHECLTQALMAGERGDRGTGSCPVCRKTLKRRTGGHVIPLALMTRRKYQELHGMG